MQDKGGEVDAGHLPALADDRLQPGMDRLEVAGIEAAQRRREMPLDRRRHAVREELAGHAQATQPLGGLDLAQDPKTVAHRSPEQRQCRRELMHAGANVGYLHRTDR